MSVAIPAATSNKGTPNASSQNSFLPVSHNRLDRNRLAGSRQRLELRLQRRAAVFDENTVIIFNRMLLFLLPKTLLKGTLRDLVFRDPVDDVVAMAKAKDINSGLAESMVFTFLDDPNKKLTLTEKSSRTISDIRERAAGPRNAQTTTYVKVYRYISDFGYQGPFDIKMDCINYQLGAPLR